MKINFPLLAIFLLFFLSLHTVLSEDDAANYSQGQGNWQSNSHRGTLDWGDWLFSRTSSTSDAGRFIGSSTFGGGDIDTDGKSFGLFAHSGTFSAARRAFAKPRMTTGDVLTFTIAVNYRNGAKGAQLRDASDNSLWRFITENLNGTDGYYVNDQDVGLGGYHANTIFTVTITQHATDIQWQIDRTGGITATASGTSSIPSGSVRFVRFFVANTENGDPQNNLYFNSLNFIPGTRGNDPLNSVDRWIPGFEPSYFLRFEDATANQVLVNSSDDWSTSHPMTLQAGVWELDVRDLNLPPGYHQFKFRPDGEWEPDPNRTLYIRSDGKIAKPSAVYLTWQQDPTTTMTVHWINQDPDGTTLRYRLQGESTWIERTADETRPFPYTERLVHIVELTGLSPNTIYEFEVDQYVEIYSFRTMPSDLSEPVRAAFTGDILYGEDADQMATIMGSHDPAFLMIGGDLAYSDARADMYPIEYQYFESFHTRLRAPDGMLIPIIVGIGNHEVRKGWLHAYPHWDDTDAWRAREAPYFFSPYAFPGQPGYDHLDFGEYLRLVILDTDHVNPVDGHQRDWLEALLQDGETPHFRHLFPIIHVPAYPSHRSSQDQNNIRIRQHWLPLFEAAGVNLVFEHHDHTYKRTPPLLNDEMDADGIVYLGDGAWGVGIRTVKDPEDRTDLLRTGSIRHAYLATLTDTGRLVQAINADNEIFDTIFQVGDGIPPAPAGLQVTRATSESVTLTWERAARAHTYQVWRNGSLVGDNLTEPRFTDTDRSASTSAEYTLHAINRSGTSDSSLPITAATTPVPPTPATPTGLSGMPLGPHSVQLEWSPVLHAYTYRIYRNASLIADDLIKPVFSDASLTADTEYTYTVRSVNVTGESVQSSSITVRTTESMSAFELDGVPDSPGYLMSQPAMRIHAALRGTELYVSTWTPAGGTSDHFIFVTDELLPAATRGARWNKKGFIAHPSGKPYIGAESTTSDFIGWFDAPASANAFRSDTGGEKIEGTLDLVEAFGHLPPTIYIAAASYGTDDLNTLNSQGPLGNGDENIDPDEFLAIPVEAIRDNAGVGFFERLDPARGFAIDAADAAEDQPFRIEWKVVPNRAYHIWRMDDLDDRSSWERLTTAPIVIPSGMDTWVFEDIDSSDINRTFYAVESIDL